MADDELFNSCLSAVLSSLKESKGADFAFKEEQVKCLYQLFCKKDVLAVMPTGFGKSLIFQSLVLLAEEHTKTKSFVLVIVPLRSIIEDQIMELSNIGITACAIESTELDLILMGKYSIVYGSAESVTDVKFVGALRKASNFRTNLAACVIDETHTVQTWGCKRKGKGKRGDVAAFRSAFGDLAILRSFVKEGTPFAALTGTADESTKKVVKEALLLKEPMVVAISPNRENIRFSIAKLKKEDLLSGLNWLITMVKDKGNDSPKTIIFCNTLNDIACVVNYLMLKLGHAAYSPRYPTLHSNCLVAIYHSSGWEKSKKAVLDSLKDPSGRIRVVVASSALSMGVNFPNIRYVVNYGPARNLLDQHQEIGRGGRDGLQSHSLILYHGQQLTHCESDVKVFVRSEGCMRVAAYKVLDAGIQPLHPQHLCCKTCSSSCCCQESDCQSSAPLFETTLSSENTVPLLSRPVNEEDKADIKDALLEIKDKLSCESLFLDGAASHGFSDQLVEDVIKNCHRIFTVSDLLDTCPIFSLINAVRVLEVIQEIFMDIPNFDEAMEILSRGKLSNETQLQSLPDLLENVDFDTDVGLSSGSDQDELPEVLL